MGSKTQTTAEGLSKPHHPENEVNQVIAPHPNTRLSPEGSSADDEAPSKESTKINQSPPQWLPRSLKWQYLCVVLATTFVILAVVIALHATSQAQSGLADDDGSSGTYFISRFVPTLVAVAYVFSTTVILDDVKRSEPFARLSSQAGAPVINTLFWVPGAWWATLYDSLPSTKRKQAFSFAMFCSSSVLILGFLILSPFSSTLLVTQDVVFSQDTTFGQLSLSSSLPIRATASSTTYFRTIGNVLQNVTTSAWITENYAILPFWPADVKEGPMGAFVGTGSEVWSAETLVINTELECEALDLAEVSLNRNPEITMDAAPFISFESSSGCRLSMTVDNSTSYVPFASWTAPSDFASDDAWASNTSGCVGDDVMLYATALFVDNDNIPAPDPNAHAKGSLCSAHYYLANTTVTVSVGSGESVVSIDEEAYKRTRQPVPSNFLDVPGLQTLFLNTTSWPQRLFSGYYIELRGPGALLAAGYEYSLGDLVQDQMSLSKATRLKQRFLGEVLRDTFDSALLLDDPRIQVVGKVRTNRRRVVVVPVAAVTLEVVLSINLILLLVTFVASRPSRRPLQLHADPATSINIASLVLQDLNTLRPLNDPSILTPAGLLAEIKDLWCKNIDNVLYIFDSGHRNPQNTTKLIEKVKKKSSLPWVLHLIPATCLFFILLAISVAIAALLGYSETDGLYQTAFVYQIGFEFAGMQLDAINPASILTTLLASSIALWWGSVDSSIRKLQPFLALAKLPLKGTDGAGLSYESSYMLWAAARALKRKQWILVLVTCGAFQAEIFTIAMSALWSRTHSVRSFVIDVPVSLEIRQVPLLMVGHFNDHDFYSSAYEGEVLRETFINQTTSWMYGANIQLTLNGSEPAWSSNGWSFAPVDLSSVPSRVTQNIGKDPSTADETGAPLPSATLAILDTAGVHARLECTPYDNLDDSSNWTTKQNLTNSTYWNTTVNPSLETAYELGTIACSTDNPNIGLGMFCGSAGGINVSTTFYVQPPQLACCENRTGDAFGPASVGYWSANRPPGRLYPEVSDVYPFNITIKWLRGTPQEGFVMANASAESRRLLWHEPPQMTALNCRPILETANAHVTVDIASHKVHDFTITSETIPVPNAWTDIFSYHIADEEYPSDINGYPVNITVSSGAYFLAAMVGASDTSALSATARSGYPDIESLDDQTFNIREPGFNLDYMSYSMYSLVGFDPTALLDKGILEKKAQQVFSTFFQHFASTSVTTTGGGWAFQKLDERLPTDLTDVADRSMVDPPANPRAGEMVTVEVLQPIEVLRMSRVAAAIALAILLWLLVTTVALTYRSQNYKARLRWRIETIADVIMMVSGSERLIELVKDKGSRGAKYDSDAREILGEFVTKAGTKRWGVELVANEAEEAQSRRTSVTGAIIGRPASSSLARPSVSEPLLSERVQDQSIAHGTRA
ncbi:hypothetical protein LTR84_007053 [Exophiala bonariae]|uniref:Ig-like domain-containing protein n=1 Tax=Exophiala bonariae TaxID=1690606 RepID=A0AAV9N2R5_9EURO|nr:hypothetical protein LTR84_007053 [Exophiala bonariae]